MFSRDSQFFRKSQTAREQPYEHIGHDSSRDESMTHHNSSGNGVNSQVPISEVPISEMPISEMPALERSQSWQVAPNLFISFKYAWAGIAYAFSTQRNFRVHTAVGFIAISLCWILKVSTVEVAVVCLTIGAVLVMEILNTALESLVDLTVGQTYHELAKVAKDCAAGAVLMAATVALTIAILIFAPPLWDNLHHYTV